MAQKNTGAPAPTIANGKINTSVDRFTLGVYWAALRHYKKAAIIMTIAFSLTAICFGTLLPYILAQAVELVSQGQSITWGSGLSTSLLVAGGIAISGVLCNAIGLRSFIQLDTPVQNHLRKKVFNRLVHENAKFYANTMTGSLTSHIIAFTNGYAAVQDVIFLRGINLAVPLAVGIGIIFYQSPVLAICFIAIALLISLKTISDSKKRAPYRRARKEAASHLNGFMGDVVINNAAVRAFASEAQEIAHLELKQKVWQLASQANMHIFSQHFVSLMGSINILQVAGVGLAAWLAATGSISLGLVVFALAYFQRLSNGLLELAPLMQNYQGALMDASPISELLMTQPTLINDSTAKDIQITSGSISFKAVSFRHEPQSPPVFTALNLHIPAGQSVGLVGRSGEGKTTLTNLLLRFVDVNSGSVSIDGQNIRHVTQQSLRQAISYVPQDSQLFHRTIHENIAYGNPQVSTEQVIMAAKKAHIWDYITSLPQGLRTEVGERGVKLSGGQRQRVAIARAILKDAPILVFDEATSALDSESEQYIQQSLSDLIKNRTAIVIAHRLSTIQQLDRIIVLDQGTVVEDGSHQALIRKKRIYASLWEHQSGGFLGE